MEETETKPSYQSDVSTGIVYHTANISRFVKWAGVRRHLLQLARIFRTGAAIRLIYNRATVSGD
jgi:hypothetical protein